MDKQVLVKVTLKGEEVRKFEAVKKHKGVLANSEVVRILVNDSYEQIEREA